MRKRGFIVFAVLMIMCLIFTVSSAQSPQITSGLNYLISTQNPDGPWGDDLSGAEVLPSTVAVIEALQTLNQASDPAYSNATAWLQSQGLETTDYLSERIYALSVAGTDNALLLSYIDQLANAWGGHNNYEVNNLDTVLALKALRRINYSDQNVISSALGYLVSTQNPDGGWGFYEGDQSNVYMTALVLSTFSQYKATYNLQTPINNAASYLLTKQNPDSGFGPSTGSGSTTYETALSIVSLIESGKGSALVLQNAINYISSIQLANGSWNEDPYSTALALRALANVKPNLSISSSDITFSNPAPTVGDTITITATIKNTGPSPAPSTGSGQVTVQFFDGDPNTGGTLIGETTLSSIPAYGSATASVSWTVTGASTKVLYVKVDPANSIDELKESDNSAYKNLAAATLPDLSITPADISIFPPAPDAYIMVGVFFKARNHGQTSARNVVVDVYYGDPAQGGMKLPGSGTIAEIPAGGSVDSVATIPPEYVTGGAKSIHILLDPQDTIIESSEANNKAIKTFIVGSSIDLSVSQSGISFNPSNPKEGDIVTITATVTNYGFIGSGTARNVTARFYLGDPSSGGVGIGPDIIIPEILPRSSVSVSTLWDSTGHPGNNSIYIVADPDNSITEDSEHNNIAFKTLRVALGQGADLTLSSSDITFTPQSPMKGDIVMITANIRNIGSRDAYNVPLEFSIYDPNINASLIIGSATLGFIPKAGASAAQLFWDTAAFAGAYELHVDIDPANNIPELIETNNNAYVPITVNQPQGPDIFIASVDTSGVISDAQTRVFSGNVTLTIKNNGTQDTALPFAITVFEDRNNNQAFDSGTDSILGQTIYSGSLPSGSTAQVTFSVSGTVLFISSPLYLFADSGSAITETDETNNVKCLPVFTTCRNYIVDQAIKTGASWLIDHQLNVDAQGTMKAWGITSLAYIARAIKAYVATEKISGTKYANVLNKLISMQAPDGSWDESLATTAEAILSLLYIGIKPDSTSITDAVSWIIRQQNTDGGWGVQIGSQSMTDYTGIALTTILKAGLSRNDLVVQKAVQWLSATQNSDGYWGSIPGQPSSYFVDTYPIIGLALATSLTDSRVVRAKNWYSFYRYSYEFTRLYWLRMMLEIEPYNTEIPSVATMLLNSQMLDGGWRWFNVYPYSSFEMTANTLYFLGKLGFVGNNINNGILWIENHINSLWAGFSEYRAIDATDYALNALQAASINDPFNLNAIKTGRKAIVGYQLSNGSWGWDIPSSGSGFILPTGISIFALKYSQNLLPDEQSAIFKGINLLVNTQNDNGGWSSYIYKNQYPSELDKTEYALFGLLQAGLTSTHTAISKGLLYLNSKQNLDGGFGNTSQTSMAAIIYKLAGANYADKLNQTIAWLKANQNPDGGWGALLGYTSTTGGTSWAIIALSFANESGIEVARGVSWLLAAQNQDKGWGSLIGIPMSYEGTSSLAVWALSLAKFSMGFNLDVAVERQSYCPTDVVRISAVPDMPAQDISLSGSVSLQEGGTYPLSFILAGNTFNAEYIIPDNALPGTATVHIVGTSVYGYGVGTTSFAIRNCSSVRPDPSVSSPDISETADPQNIDLRTVYATIRNLGGIGASNVVVNFYKGAPSLSNLIESKIIPNLPASASYTLSTSITITEDTLVSVSVDPDNTIIEVNEYNNMASIALTRISPDLSITSSDIAIVPPDVVEGQHARITALIHNIGNLGASDVVVSFYDGDPQSSGILIGSVTKSYIDSGATSLAEIEWSTFGQSGRNYIHVIVDPQNNITESNENNNQTLIPVDITPPSKPDLATASSEMTFSNLNPAAGELLIINANIHNLGTDTGDITVALYDGDPLSGGILIEEKTIARIIPFGEHTVISFEVNTIGLAGEHRFYIVVDPANTIDEINETNNAAWNYLTIGSSGLTLNIATDKTLYTANEDVQITLNINNLMSTTRSGTLEVKITDLSSNLVSTVSSQVLTLNPNENIILNLTWNTAATFAGDYKVYGHFIVNGNIKAKAETPISITPVQAITSKVFTNRTSYLVNEPVTITSTIRSTSPNYIFENLRAHITVSNQQSALYTETQDIPILLPEQMVELKTYWNTGTTPSGTYPATLEIKDISGNGLSVSTTNLTISSDITPSMLLRGQISVDKQSILQGEPVNITYSVTNIGNADLSQIDLSVLTVHVVTLSVYDTLTDQTALQRGGTYSNTQQLDTQSYSAKDYLVILRAAVGGEAETLASTYFRVQGAPSAPSLHSPQHGSDAETPTPVLTVNNASDPNDDRLTYQFELYGDGSMTNRIALSPMIDEGAGTTAWQVPLVLQENAVYYWRARAYDSMLYGDWMLPAALRVNTTNEPPTAPTLSAPAEGSSVDTAAPALTVNNASDPDSAHLTYNFVLSPVPDFTSDAVSVSGIFEGEGKTSWQVPFALNENKWYYWSAQADDWLDTGPWMQTASFFVNTINEAPSAPVVIYPANGAEITTLATDITVSNSTDPDSPALTYTFETDTVNTFDSPHLIRTGSIPEGQGTTSTTRNSLQDNSFYYVRAKATDGQAESQWSEVSGFFVNTANDPPTVPVLANPSDNGAVNTFTPVLSVHNSTDPDGDMLTYDFEVYRDMQMTNLITSGTNIPEMPQITPWNVPVSLTENSTYRWRARAFDGELYSGWMPLASFMVNTANDAPGAPVLYSPAHGSSLDTLYPTLSVRNAVDPDNDVLTYDFEIYREGMLIRSITGIPEVVSGITSLTVNNPLAGNASYSWRARAYDGDRYGAWMDMAGFSIYLPPTNITATIDFDPNTLNKKSKGTWVVVYIEMPQGYRVSDINIASVLLNNTVPAEPWPYAIGDYDKDGIPDLMVKFRRDQVISILPLGEKVKITVTGNASAISFEGMDIIRVIE